MSKYGNRKTTVNGITFDSKAEAARYQELRLLEQAGAISGLTLQPKWQLLPSFKHDGKTERAISYIADFKYMDEDGQWVVEDVKGTRTEAYKIKRKLFLSKYGHSYDFREVAA
ncbi:MAG: DUF1064 domain-containing protein [Chloroflexi bacterium]|nr:DUF1064 domain-containing protein [Chloroflexota bacterium]